MQYSTNTTTVEAYCLGDTEPDWMKDIRIQRIFKTAFGSGMVLDCIQVATMRGDAKVYTGDYIVYDIDADTFSAYTKEAFETLYLKDDATLVSVLGETLVLTTGSSKTDPITYDIDVANTVTTVGLADLVVGTDATKLLFKATGFTTPVTGSSTIALVAETKAYAYIQVTSKHGTLVDYYKIGITRAAEA